MTSVTGIDFPHEWRQFVKLIGRRGIGAAAVLKAKRSVPRAAFLPPELHAFAYHTAPLRIGNVRTNSQPFLVASMAAAHELKTDDRMLDVGTGAGHTGASSITAACSLAASVPADSSGGVPVEERLHIP
jgi:protein-L-isoaspartate(D-aspartate) O-methyltransferase